MDSCSHRSRLPAAPTDAVPGSAEKIRVLAERARLRMPLWHPLDAHLSGDAPAPDAPAARESCAAAQVA